MFLTSRRLWYALQRQYVCGMNFPQAWTVSYESSASQRTGFTQMSMRIVVINTNWSTKVELAAASKNTLYFILEAVAENVLIPCSSQVHSMNAVSNETQLCLCVSSICLCYFFHNIMQSIIHKSYSLARKMAQLVNCSCKALGPEFRTSAPACKAEHSTVIRGKERHIQEDLEGLTSKCF